MTNHWKRSRVTKALTDNTRAGSFFEAEDRLNAVRVSVVLGRDQLHTQAGQAAALTAIATARKCFGRVTLVTLDDARLIAPLPLGRTLRAGARRLGARCATQSPKGATHIIRIGGSGTGAPWEICCWWDRWLSGTRADERDVLGDSRLALAGIFAGALAVRQIFACVLAGKNVPPRNASVSLWEPWMPAAACDCGPAQFDVPDKLWLVGLGHLGQAFVWCLCHLACDADRLAVLQDDQKIGEENEATSLLVLPGKGIGARKVRLASAWLEAGGWETRLLERRHHGDIALTESDPPYLLCGVDRVEPRIVLARHGFEYMLDAGIGHGPVDFEGIQLRVIRKGEAIDGLWSEPTRMDRQSTTDRLLARPAYVELARELGQCGTFDFAEASVGVPFVGAASGALVVAQAIRLASLHTTTRFLHLELGAVDMTTHAGVTTAPDLNLGSMPVALDETQHQVTRSHYSDR